MKRVAIAFHRHPTLELLNPNGGFCVGGWK